ncbi:MAG TPA: MgtC/SapB family protein [Thermodesulfobacteriota bacterium]|nr:MgtC/SapB family protein [Thermodesulfobacteriota bacterium]
MEFGVLYNQFQLQTLAYVVLAMLLGAVIGIDREIADKPAGLRTHMLVCGASTLLVSLGDIMVRHFDQNLPNNMLQSDPIRIIEAVITGVSFLGAGTIIRRGSDNIAGLTTAASILFVAAVGICVALSQISLAMGSTVLVVIILRGVHLLQQWMGLQHQKKDTEKSKQDG